MMVVDLGPKAKDDSVTLEMFKLLLGQGVPINQQTKTYRTTVLMKIAKRGRVDLAEELLKRTDIRLELKDKDENNALFYAKQKEGGSSPASARMNIARNEIAEMIQQKMREYDSEATESENEQDESEPMLPADARAGGISDELFF